MRVKLISEGDNFKLVAENGSELFVQSDYDLPLLARSLGWVVPRVRLGNNNSHRTYCAHESTDGTILCFGCNKSPEWFIRRARQYLNKHIGMVANDPGYFEERDAS